MLHARPWGQLASDTFFKIADNTVSDSDVQIPTGKNVQMKARLILLRKLIGWEQISLPPKKLKKLETENYRRIGPWKLQ